MKTLTCILVCLSAVSAIRAQVADLTGTWSMTGYSYVENGVTLDEMTEEMMGDTLITNFFFLDDGKFRQTTNMSGSGTLDTYEGTWKTSGDKLVITLSVGGRNMDLDYTCESSDNILVLTRTSPSGTSKIVSSYRKKQ